MIFIISLSDVYERLKIMLSGTVEGLKQVATYLTQVYKVARDERLSAFTIVVEQVLLYLCHHVDVRTYFTYRLFDPSISWQDKTTYLPSDDTPGVKTMLAMHTPPRYARCFRDKVVFNVMFRDMGLPLARLHAVFNGKTNSVDNVALLNGEAELDAWMRATDVAELAYKPVRGVKGKMILIFAGRAQDDAGTFVTLAGERYDARKLASFSGEDEFFFEERIRPHPVLAELLGETLCCVRVLTMVGLDRQASILGAVFKVQTGSVGVDHLIYGAVGAWVDLESGRLHQGRTRYSLKPTWQIPGTDRSYQGFHLPCWDEVKSLALKAAQGMPNARSIGWDVAISDRGPVLIEGNDDWSMELIQMPAPYGLMRGEFKALCDALREQELRRKQ